MPTLNWIGKEAVINHDKEVPFRLLKKVKARSATGSSQNLIIHGDNLEALKALIPYYYGKVKCIYIDPPYNTGSEKWVYNDKVNSPKIKKWLGKVVGGDTEDLCRHDKWLCMMYPRLKLLRDLLCDEGVIFVSIDDNEFTHLKKILDEIYGDNNFLGTIIWQTATDNNPSQVAIQHEYVLTYAKNKSSQTKWIGKSEGARQIQERYEILREEYKDDIDKIRKELRKWIKENIEILKGVSHYSYVDEKGVYYPDNPSNPHPGGYKFKVIHPVTKKVCRIPPNGYRWPEKTFKEYLKEGNIEFGEDETITPKPKKRLSNAKELLRSVYYEDNRRSTNELTELMGKQVFENPKSPRLIKYLISFVVSKEDVILDSFAGSGTTAHAIMDLNKYDKGKRKFILIQIEEKLKKEIKLDDGTILKEVADITKARVKRAIQKYNYADGFEYCELDKPLFNEEGCIEEECFFEQLATYIYFTETNTNLNKKVINKNFIGDYNDTEFYLLFKEKGKNILNKDFLKKINKNNKKKIIYADKCIIDSKTLEKYRIQFKQIPYEVKVY